MVRKPAGKSCPRVSGIASVFQRGAHYRLSAGRIPCKNRPPIDLQSLSDYPLNCPTNAPNRPPIATKGVSKRDFSEIPPAVKIFPLTVYFTSTSR